MISEHVRIIWQWKLTNSARQQEGSPNRCPCTSVITTTN